MLKERIGLMTPKGENAAVTEYLYRKATAAGVPLSGTFELTPVCNMDCKMCYVRLSRQEQEKIAPLATGQQWLELAERVKELGLLYLLVTGGEPFSHPQIREILEGLHKMGLVVAINTNGTLIDENTVQWLKKCPPARINITLYGTSDATYGRLCRNPKGFTQTVSAIRLLKEAGIPVKLNCSLTPDNLSDLEGIVAFAKEQELYVQVATYMFPPMRKDPKLVGQNDRLPPELAAYYAAYCEYLTLGKETFLERGCGVLLPDQDSDCAQVGDGVRCRAGRCSFWVTWKGDLLPCGMFSVENCPNVFREDFAGAWHQVKQQVAEIRLPVKCASCAVKDTCHACAAMVITESGDTQKVPQYRCDMIRSYPEQWQRVKEEIL